MRATSSIPVNVFREAVCGHTNGYRVAIIEHDLGRIGAGDLQALRDLLDGVDAALQVAERVNEFATLGERI